MKGASITPRKSGCGGQGSRRGEATFFGQPEIRNVYVKSCPCRTTVKTLNSKARVFSILLVDTRRQNGGFDQHVLRCVRVIIFVTHWDINILHVCKTVTCDMRRWKQWIQKHFSFYGILLYVHRAPNVSLKMLMKTALATITCLERTSSKAAEVPKLK